MENHMLALIVSLVGLTLCSLDSSLAFSYHLPGLNDKIVCFESLWKIFSRTQTGYQCKSTLSRVEIKLDLKTRIKFWNFTSNTIYFSIMHLKQILNYCYRKYRDLTEKKLGIETTQIYIYIYIIVDA